MTLDEAISRLGGPTVGMTTLIAAAMSLDFSSVPKGGADSPATPPALRAAAETKLAALKEAQNKAQSDWAWWGYAGDIGYWTAIVNLTKAAEICGADRLPDVDGPEQGVVVMDQIANQESWARQVLIAAEATSAAREAGEK